MGFDSDMMVGEVGIYTYNHIYIYILYNYLYPVMITGINVITKIPICRLDRRPVTPCTRSRRCPG